MGKLVVLTHKEVWRDGRSPSGYSTDGGFPLQMKSLSGLFDQMCILAPVVHSAKKEGQIPLSGDGLRVRPLTALPRSLTLRRLLLVPWFLLNLPRMIAAIISADAVHTPIPGDIGTLGMVIAQALRRPLFVRYCGNWHWIRTRAERFWRWFLVRYSRGTTVALATGMDHLPPSEINKNIHWIFSTSLTEAYLKKNSRLRSINASQPLRLICVCRQEPAKGTALVIECLPWVLKSRDVYLDVVGDGSAMPELRALAKKVPSNRVFFHGRKNQCEVFQLLSKADIFCFPSRSSEGFPKAVLEAMAHGLPVVASKVSALPSMLERGGGSLLDELTVECLGKTILELTDPVTYESKSHQAILFAADYSLEKWRACIYRRLSDAWGSAVRLKDFKGAEKERVK